MTAFSRAKRLDRIPPYLFVELDRAKRALIEQGIDLVDLGIGDPDCPTFPEVVDALRSACTDPTTHTYPSQRGEPALRKAVAAWFETRYGVALDPEREVLALIGTKEGLGHLPLAVLNSGDTCLVPDPAYPVYQSAALLAGAEVVHMPLEPDLGFRPDLDGLPRSVLNDAKLAIVNFPNNPTGAAADEEFFQLLINRAEEHGFVAVNDGAYSELVFDTPRISLLQADGGREVGVELHSFSKTFNMTGWRIGFALGNPDVLDALATVKNNVDSGAFTAIQRAAMVALSLPQERIDEQVELYRRRRDVLVDGLWEAGWQVRRPHASFYVWARVPSDEDSSTFAARLMNDAHVVVTPGSGFGPSGEGYVRMALTATEERIAEGVARIRRIL